MILNHKAIRTALIDVISSYQPISPNDAVSKAQKLHDMRFSDGRTAILMLIDNKTLLLTPLRQLMINSENLDWAI